MNLNSPETTPETTPNAPSTPNALEIIKHFEGFSPTVYKCPSGLPTIGYGHVLQATQTIPLQVVNQQQALLLLHQDLLQRTQQINKLLRCQLSQGQREALLSFVYNVGIGAFAASSMLRLLNAHKTDAAAQQFSRWVFSRGRKLKGLILRRYVEKHLFVYDNIDIINNLSVTPETNNKQTNL